MACCSGKKTAGIEPKSIKNESDPSSEKIKPIIPVKSLDSTIEYEITIKTGNNRNSSTNGPVYIKIFGRDDKQTDDMLLTNSFIQQDSTKKLQIKAIDIGKPQRIIIRHEDKTNGWFIDYVDISVHNFRIRFVANRWLDETKYDRKLSAELFGSEQPAAWYSIEVETGSEQIEPLDSPVYMQIYGTTTNTPKIFLESKNASFTKDSKAKFNISSNNVGEIQKIVIGHEGIGTINDWYLQSIKIQTDAQHYEFNINKWLSPTKGDKQLFIELNPKAPRASSPTAAMYLVTVQTGDVQQEKTIENIEMSIRGSDGQIDKILLKDHVKSNEQKLFQKGSLDQFEIKHKDIGNIESITIGFNDNDQKSAWLLESVDITYKETVYHFRAQCWLSSRLGPNFKWTTIKPDTNDEDINYKVIIDTGKSGIDANVILCIYGEKDTTQNFALRTTKDGTQAKFDKDSRLEFDLKAIDVGKIKKINIGHDGKGNEQQWFLKSIEIEKKNEHYTFKADRCLSEGQESFIDLLPEESSPRTDQVMYTITVVTSSEDDSSTDSGVFMTIYGEKGRSKEFQLIKSNQDSESLFKQGQTSEFQLELNDVGIINKINIGQDGKGLRPLWHPKSVQIQKGSEIYTFNVDQVLDLSTPYVDLKPLVPVKSPRPETPQSTSSREKVVMKETTYKAVVRFGSLQQSATDDDDDTNLYMVIIGVNGQTKKMPLLLNKQGEIEFTTTDVGQISKILLGQDETEHGTVWHVDNIIIEKGDETTTFNVERPIEQNTVIELTPSPIRKSSNEDTNNNPKQTKASISTEASTTGVKRKEQEEKKKRVTSNRTKKVKTHFSFQMKRSQSAKPYNKSRNDTDYKIKIGTGEKAFDGTVNIQIRGEHGIISIPLGTLQYLYGSLSKTKNGERPYQSKSIDEFTSRTVDVGKIKRITIELNSTEKGSTWDLKKIQIIKGNRVYNFTAHVRLDSKKSKITLYPLDQRKEDYVQSELRRLQDNLRNESSKMRRPKHKSHEPFVYNDLNPYFDTSTVEKAIYGPLETPSGYYTRVTALRVVEPWEAYGMDYGVNYELLKQRRSRAHSAKRSSSTQHGLMILPPLSLPYGGQIAYVNSPKATHSRSSSAAPKRRSSSKQNKEHVHTTTITA